MFASHGSKSFKVYYIQMFATFINLHYRRKLGILVLIALSNVFVYSSLRTKHFDKLVTN